MPKRTSSESAIVLPTDAHKFNLKPGTVQLLPTFHGLEKENPYNHLRLFEEVCSTCFDDKTDIESVYLKLFPFSVKGKQRIGSTLLGLIQLLVGLICKLNFFKSSFH